ncbi:tetratricopeptide repeat protein [Teladorsagia circumcincta]|uniref:peptidylprolyl isomerase n=1 Tax=Teladorsagia circumcincta TaxID=45464 RepID=A0A2G9V0I5_TELCI|nr:tetratricopeptide repeat protein [Teladorsagia circumcincta]
MKFSRTYRNCRWNSSIGKPKTSRRIVMEQSPAQLLSKEKNWQIQMKQVLLKVGLPEGVDRALRRFCRGEKSTIRLSGTRFTYGPNPPPEYNLPPNATIEFTIFLKSYEKVPALWEMSAEKKIEEATLAKERGTAFLKQNKLKLAYNKYKRIEDILEFEKSMDPEQKKVHFQHMLSRDDLMLAAYLNLALTASKMGENLDCIKYCDKALELSPINVKALYRKAGARAALSDFDEAKQIYEKILEVDPENKAAAQQILVVRQMMKEQLERDKKRYKNLFSKISDDSKAEKQSPFEEKKAEATTVDS